MRAQSRYEYEKSSQEALWESEVKEVPEADGPHTIGNVCTVYTYVLVLYILQVCRFVYTQMNAK